MVDLKNKFMDILFEDDPEDIINEVEARQAVSSNKDDTSISAKDLLYRGNGSDSVFINLDDTPKIVEEDPSKKSDEYELSTQISPIFGVIEKAKKKVVSVDPVVRETQTTKPADAHLDIITSPIYGYGNKEDALDNNYDVKGIDEGEDEDAQLHHLFDESEPINNDVMSDEPLDEEDINLFRLFGDNK